MKVIAFLLVATFGVLGYDSGIYNLSFQNLAGNQVNLSDYKGKRIVIIEFRGLNIDSTRLRYLDSIQVTNSDKIQIIGVPANEFSGTINQAQLKTFIDSMKLSVIISKPLNVKRGGTQHAIFKWLTDVSQNSHFDFDPQEEGHIFFISEKGVLYAILSNATPRQLLLKVLKQEYIQE